MVKESLVYEPPAEDALNDGFDLEEFLVEKIPEDQFHNFIRCMNLGERKLYKGYKGPKIY